jgi:hypothetical protein
MHAQFLTRRSAPWRALLICAAALTLLAASIAPVAASAPANDSYRTAIRIDSIPFTNSQDTTEATSSSTDPGYCHDPSLGRDPATVWYSYTATSSGPLGVTTFGSDYDTTLYVGTLKGSRLQVVACGDDSRTLQSAVRFDAVTGQTFYFVVGTSPFAGVNGGNLVFNLDVGPVKQVVDLVVDPVGHLSGTNVVFQGTVSCTAPTTFQSVVVAELTQSIDGREAAGTGFFDITSCPGSDIPFEIRVPNDIGKFRPGEATAQFIFAACNDFECGNKVLDLTVQIER